MGLPYDDATAARLKGDLLVKDGGSWRYADRVWVKQSGTWRSSENIYVKSGGSWRDAAQYDVYKFKFTLNDNNNGFEVYQKHGASTTRNTFAVYANTGSSGAKQGQFLVRGDGVVSVGGDFGFDKFTPDGTITTTISSNSSSGNYTTIIPLNTSGISHLHVYLVSIHWSFNSNGSAPYYCSGAVLWQTPHTNQSNGVGYPYEMLSLSLIHI